MFKVAPKARLSLRIVALVLSAGLFAYLVWRAGPSNLWKSVVTLGWGFTWVIALAGVSHLAKTWAWQMTLEEDKCKLPFAYMLGLRLGAEAAGQLGILGQTFGDSVRVSRLSHEMRVAKSLASVTLDRGLFVVTGTVITVAGLVAALPVLAPSHVLRLYAGILAMSLVAFLVVTLAAVRMRWPVFSGSARIISRVPSLRKWIEKEHQLIRSAENALFDFHHNSAKAFWGSFSLNLAGHCLAVLEVCLILWLLGAKIGFFSALAVEALTKLVNVMGNFNPGNIGTYEGGNMLIGKMFGLSAATGLALGVARRLRSLFWAAVGGVCLVLLTKTKKQGDSETLGISAGNDANEQVARKEVPNSVAAVGDLAVAILPGDTDKNGKQFCAALARVGSLPVLLRSVLTAQKLRPSRIMIVVNPESRSELRREMVRTKRLPPSVQWVEAPSSAPLAERLRLVAAEAGSKLLIVVERSITFHSSLLRKAGDWNAEGVALAITTGDKPVGIYALTVETAKELAAQCGTQAGTLAELHGSLTATHRMGNAEVPAEMWQKVSAPVDCVYAERKLDRWLVKPTDGFYAQLNRRISIPISRQLIKFPITANMVSIFTLGVGFVSALFFGLGGYWNTLLGAFLCLFASILDGCDGEVARLKFLESDFGCWLETICDYAFYLLLFVGMTIGRWRSSGSKAYLVYGGLLLFGAIASFLATGWERQRLAAGHPEQLLGIWQKHADSRPSNPFLFYGRRLEFMIRRCFFP